MVSLEHFVDCK